MSLYKKLLVATEEKQFPITLQYPNRSGRKGLTSLQFNSSRLFLIPRAIKVPPFAKCPGKRLLLKSPLQQVVQTFIIN